MRILYLCPDLGIPVLGRRGGSVHVRGLVAALSRAGHDVVIAAPHLTRSPWEPPAAVAAQVLHLPPSAAATAVPLALETFNDTLGVVNCIPDELRCILYNQELGAELRRRFTGHPPDAIYERASLYATAGATLAAELNVPLLVEFNAPLAVEQERYRGSGLGGMAAQAERWLLARADAVLTVSAPLRDYALSRGMEPDRVHVFPNGVDAALFHPGPPDPAVAARWNLVDGEVLGFVGGLQPWHGLEVLPALLERLRGRRPDLRLVIVGDGRMRGALEREVRTRGLASSVVFTGAVPQEEVVELIRGFDVALAPYPKPQHAFYFSPLKLFEYMACGTPVVAAGLGQIAEVMRDGETGLLYPPGDLDALTAACDRLLADQALGRRLGRAAAQEIHTCYTWDQNAARVVALAQMLRAEREMER